jgi:sterol desaturase/sphingolipid hydroxylase (fatty acid hydroxylase superfamily)
MLFIKNNIVLVAILLFLSIYIVINAYKPGFMYNKDGSFREFGVGYRKKTIIPAWLLAIVLAIFAYFSVMYFVN